MQVHHNPTKILICGKSGVGKTTYMQRYFENAGYNWVFIFDHKSESLTRLGIEPSYSVEEMLEKLKEGQRVISYNHTQEYPGDAKSAFAFFCEWVYETCKILGESGGKSLFVGDEVNRFTSTSGGDKDWEFNQLIEDGRLQGLDFIGTSHATNQINNRLRLQLSEVVAMKVNPGQGPLSFLEDLGFDVERVVQLKKGQFISLDLEGDTGFTEGKLFSTGQDLPPPATPDSEEEGAVPPDSNQPTNVEPENTDNPTE